MESFNGTIVEERFKNFNVMIYRIVQSQVDLLESVSKKKLEFKDKELLGDQKNELQKLDKIGAYSISCDRSNVFSMYEKLKFTGGRSKYPLAVVDFNNYSCTCGIPQDCGIMCSHVLGIIIDKQINYDQYLKPYVISPTAYDYTKIPIINPSVIELGNCENERYSFERRNGKKNRILSIFKDEKKLMKWIKKSEKHK